jgi:hypothetical protein
MGEAARDKTSQFGVRNVVPRIVEVYEDALRDRSSKKSGAATA